MPDPQKPRRRPKRREGYYNTSPAICLVVHDLHGRPMPDAIAAQILNAVTDIAVANDYLINFTRT